MRFVLPLILLFLLFLFLIPASAQEKNSLEKELAISLIKTKSEQERHQLLAANKILLTVELRKALIIEGEQLLIYGEFSEALEVFKLTQNVSTQLGDKAGVGHAIRWIGIVHSDQGDSNLALDYFKQTLAIAEQIEDESLKASTLRSIGVSEFHLGNIDKSLEAYQASLAIGEALQDNGHIASNLSNIGSLYMHQGNFRVALGYLEKGLALRNEIGNQRLIADSLNNIAIIHDSQGNYAHALELYRKSLKIREELGDKANIANVMSNMGDYRLLGDYDLALEYNNRSLALAEELGDQRLVARALINIGNIYLKKGDAERALKYGLKCMPLTKKLGYSEVEASSQKLLANAYFMKGNYEKSLEYAELAVMTARKIGDRQLLWTGLEARGKAYSALQQPDKARQNFEEAIATIEDWRYLVAGAELEQQSLFAEKLSPYHEMISLLINQNLTTQALEYSERAKARVLLDVLRSGKVEISGSLSSQEQLREQKLNQELVSINKEIQRASSNTNSDQVLLTSLSEKLQKTRLEWEAARAQLYAAHPELKVKRGETSPLFAKTAIDFLPDSQTAFLEYVVTEEATFLFVLTRENAVSVHKIRIQRETVSNKIRDFREKIANRDLGFRIPAAELYNLLIRPAAQELKRITKLVIVPDDLLWELPFQALITPGNRYLLQEKTVSFVPSLTVLKEMMNLEKKQMISKPMNLLAFGNPALGKNTLDQLKSIFRDSNLSPLPEAEKEAKTLGQLYGNQQSKIYIRADAQESRFKTEASQFRILHLATHSLLNDSSPMYSQIVLAQTGTGEEEDGLLEAREILNMNLNADLVVLSSCESALGKVGQGEGMIGLSWAFFVAGTSTTVVSQWKVDSASTTEFMLTFHEKLKSESKAEALRSAALQVYKQDHYRHPFFWAAFVLIGNGM